MRKHFFKRSSEAESPMPLTKPEGIQFEMLSWGWEVRSPSDFIEEDKQHRNGMMVAEQESEPEENLTFLRCCDVIRLGPVIQISAPVNCP